ncbi:MAG: tyrosine--tRNA ligase, partial [Candidatus Omnitrophica bacterium]|nr:tyrosine--tRNA ligase [Candidatus Omnitrophota bacterium]
MSLTEALEQIRRGSVEIISEAELAEKLTAGRPLNIKAGFDPTAPDLHLGHTVLLRKLRHFQNLGHKVIFVIGDATGLVGDPSGQSQTRKALTWDEVRVNAATYQQQVRKILLTDRARFEVRYNSEWFLGRSPQNRPAGLEQFDFMKFVQLASHATVARLIERDDFAKRLKANKPVSFLELFYPLMQGYDSVKLAEQHGACDVELGGTDQKFNLLMGRELLKAYGRAQQVVLTMPLLEGTDGVQKMSKSLGNHIGIEEPPGQM